MGLERATISSFVNVLPMFIEFGATSGQPFMGSFCNHRDLDVAFWHSASLKSKKSLIESLLVGKGSYKFDVNSKMGFYLHAVRDNNQGTNRIVMETNGAIVGDMVSSDGEGFPTRVVSKVIMKDRYMDFLDGVTFERALRFFNMKWKRKGKQRNQRVEVNAKTTKQTHAEIVSFVMLFENYKLDSWNGWSKFLNDFSIQDRFKCLETMCNEDRFYVFGSVLRALVPLRITIYDGQHRGFLMALFLQGFYHPQSYLVNVRWPFERLVDHMADKLGGTELVHEQTQLFQQHQIDISVVLDKKIGVHQLSSVLKQAGEEITNAGDISIYCTWKEIIDEVCRECSKSQEIRPLDFNNFWVVGSFLIQFKLNQSELFEIINKIISRDERKQRLVLGHSHKDISSMMSLLQKKIMKPASLVGRQLPLKCGPMFQLIRAAVQNAQWISQLQGFFLAGSSSWKQRGRYVAGKMLEHRSEDWLAAHLVECVTDVAKHMEVLVMLEIVLITYLRKKQEEHGIYWVEINEQIKDGIVTDTVDKYPRSWESARHRD